jgi:hypothetical protein
VNRLDVNKDISESQIPWRDGTDAVHGKSIVFIQQSGAYLLFLNPFSSNPADLDGRILWATDQGAVNLDLIAKEPDRTPYLQKTSVPPSQKVPSSHPVTPVVTTERLRVLDTAAPTLHIHVVNRSGSRVVVVSVQVGDHVEHRTIATDSTKGAAYDLRWDVGTLPTVYGSVTVTAGFGATSHAATDPVVRSVIPFRGDPASAKLLLPAQPATLGRINHGPAWIEATSTPELRVKVTG